MDNFPKIPKEWEVVIQMRKEKAKFNKMIKKLLRRLKWRQ